MAISNWNSPPWEFEEMMRQRERAMEEKMRYMQEQMMRQTYPPFIQSGTGAQATQVKEKPKHLNPKLLLIGA